MQKNIKMLLVSFTIICSSFNFSKAQTYLPSSTGEIIQHLFYTLSYSEDHEQAEWVQYRLTPDMLIKTVNRSDNFRPDPNISTGSASLDDYVGSGYDRGHLCPAGDMVNCTDAMSESFYLSNMSPQSPGFNRGAWKNLESVVRNWGSTDTIYVVTGPVFNSNKGQIGENKVTIPGYYYKIIYSLAKQEMIGFLMPNEKISNDLTSFIMSVDQIEQYTGIDFFSDMDATLQNKLEAAVDQTNWSFNEFTYTNTTEVESSTNKTVSQTNLTNSTSSQCKGITKSTGKRCKNTTKNSNGYCHLHQNHETVTH